MINLGYAALDLDALFDHLSITVRNPRPKQSFDGTGSVQMVNQAPMAEPFSAPLTSIKAKHEPRGIQILGDGNTIMHGHVQWRHRSRGDFSYGDLSIWAMYMICGLAQVAFSLAGLATSGYGYYNSSGNWSSNEDAMVFWLLTAASLGLLTTAIAISQYIAARNVKRRTGSPQRIMVTANLRTFVRATRRMQQAISVVAALYGLVFLNLSPDLTTRIMVLLGALLVPGIMTVITWTGFGDAAFLAGALLSISDVFFAYRLSNASVQSDLPVLPILTLVFGAIMVYAWWRHAPSLVLMGAVAFCAIPIISALATNVTMGPILSATGAVAALLAILLGDGVPIGEEIRSEYLGLFAIPRRITASLR